MPEYTHPMNSVEFAAAGYNPKQFTGYFRHMRRIRELGARPAPGAIWRGMHKPFSLICPAGHECAPHPSDIQQGKGICIVCAGQDPVTAERNFRARVEELGGTVHYTEWKGTLKPHHVRCSAGHDCYPHPGSVRQGRGICRICAGQDPVQAERNFRARVEGLGGTVLYTEWKGNGKPHHIRCPVGHDAYPRPNDVRQGQGICRVCARRDPKTAESNFRAALAVLGATPMYDRWLGSVKPHHVRCAAGHDTYPIPSNVSRGRGICRACAGQDPAQAEKNFRDRVRELGGTPVYEKWLGTGKPHHVRCPAGHDAYPEPNNITQGRGICAQCHVNHNSLYVVISSDHVKFGITSGDPRSRLADHRRDGFRETVALYTELPDGVARQAERAAIAACDDAGFHPVRGREYFPIAAMPLIVDVISGHAESVGAVNRVVSWIEILDNVVWSGEF